MAKTRTYIVSFNPAERTQHGFRTSFMLGVAPVDHQVTADNFTVLEAEVRRLALEYGRTCSPYIRLPKGERKPPGFDAFKRTLNIIDVETASAVTAA